MCCITYIFVIVTTLSVIYDFGVCSTDHWPLGSYTIPKPKSGCPHSTNNTWTEAWRYQDMENDAKQGSKVSPSFHMDAKIINNDIVRGFCTSLNSREQEPWPHGSYCIYRNSNYCPPGMTEGSIQWYDEQNNNQNKLHNYYLLPDGYYNGPSTELLYCCENQGKWYRAIELPVEKPFYLLPFGSRNCQRVKWAVGSLEYIVYDTEDTGNQDKFEGHHGFTDTEVKSLPKVFYCYYEGCQHKLTNETGSFTSSSILNGSYPDFQQCSWSIEVNVSLRIFLRFPVLDIPNCRENYLDVYDGSTILARFCGDNATSGANMTSRANNLFIVFTSGNNSADSTAEKISKRLRFYAEYDVYDADTPAAVATRSTTSGAQTQKNTIHATLQAKSLENKFNFSTVVPPTKTAMELATNHGLLGHRNSTLTISKRTTTQMSKTSVNRGDLFLAKTPTSKKTTTAKMSTNNVQLGPLPFTEAEFRTTRETSTSVPKISTKYDNADVDKSKILKRDSNESMAVYFFISFVVLGILILLGILGIVLYWSRYTGRARLKHQLREHKPSNI